MRLDRLIPAVCILFMSGPAFAQEWIDYTSRADRFSVNFPGEPMVQDIRYTSSLNGVFPARVYTARQGPNRYSVTVVDYTDALRIHTERVKTCNPDAHGGCFGTDEDGAQGVGSWKWDVFGAMDFASEQLLKRDARVTLFGWAAIDRIAGRRIRLTNADGSRTVAGIYMHEGRLYILEATVPMGAPEPGLFHQSPRFLDGEGRSVRYNTVYSNGYPAPTRAGAGGGAQGAGGQRGRGAGAP